MQFLLSVQGNFKLVIYKTIQIVLYEKDFENALRRDA